MMWAKVHHRFSATHFWPDAAKDSKHEYLRFPHRHLFHVTLKIEIYHDDREIEYMELLDWLRSVCTEEDMGKKSCEMMCRRIADLVKDRYPGRSACGHVVHRAVIVEILEDGENGAVFEDVHT